MPVLAEQALDTSEQELVALYKKCSPGVVILSMVQKEEAVSLGSGWVFDEEGHIVSNWHVVTNFGQFPAGSAEARVKFSDGTEVPAQIVGTDQRCDVAVLKVDLPPEKKSLLRPLARGGSSDLEVGQDVIEIGNPFGLGFSLTRGIVAALGRTVGRSVQLIQTDAVSNPGNSGGPIFNTKGEVIGMLTLLYVAQGPQGADVWSGVSFASPTDLVAAEAASITKYGYLRRASLGVYLEEDGSARRTWERDGCIVSSLRLPDGAGDMSVSKRKKQQAAQEAAAGKAGLISGDVIYEVGGTPVAKATDLYVALNAHEPGEEIEVKVLRPVRPFRMTQELTVKVPLKEAAPTDDNEL